MKKDFWKSWSTEYLNKLQQRGKWNGPQENIEVGDLVLIKEQIHPSKWPLARIEQVHPGNDGLVRVATVRKSGGILLKRAINDIIPLPKEEHTNAENKLEPQKIGANISVIQTSSHRKNSTPVSWWFLIMMLFSLTITTVAPEKKFQVHFPPPIHTYTLNILGMQESIEGHLESN